MIPPFASGHYPAYTTRFSGKGTELWDGGIFLFFFFFLIALFSYLLLLLLVILVRVLFGFCDIQPPFLPSS